MTRREVKDALYDRLCRYRTAKRLGLKISMREHRRAALAFLANWKASQ